MILPRTVRVGLDTEALLRATARHPASGDDLVKDEQRAVFPRDAPQGFQVAVGGRYDAHVAGDGFDEQRGDLTAVGFEGRFDGTDVVEGDREGESGERLGDARAIGLSEGHDSGPGGNQHAVGVAVVATVELHDHVAAGRCPCQSDRAHPRLGAGGDEANPLDARETVDDKLAELVLALGWRAVGGATGCSLLDGFDDCGMGVAGNERPP